MKQSKPKDINEYLNEKYGEGVIKLYQQFIKEQTSESQAKLVRNREYLKSIPKLTFDLDRELNPLVKEILETLKLRISV